MDDDPDDLAEVRAANEKLGHSWFSAETTSYHGARVETDLIGGFYFVESRFSEPGDDQSPRIYAPVVAQPNGAVQYLDALTQYDSVDAAREPIDAIVDNR